MILPPPFVEPGMRRAHVPRGVLISPRCRRNRSAHGASQCAVTMVVLGEGALNLAVLGDVGNHLSTVILV